MKHKIFSILLTICLLALPFTTLGASIADPSAGDAAWILNEDFGDEFKSDLISSSTERNMGQKATVGDASCFKVWTDYGSISRPYPVTLKSLETPVSSGYIVYKGSFMVPTTISDNVPLQNEQGEIGAAEFSIHNSAARWSDDTLFAVKFKPSASSVTASHNSSKDNGFKETTYNNVSMSLDDWHNIMIVIDMNQAKADVYLNERKVVDAYQFTSGRVAKVFGVESGYGSTEYAPAYVDDIKIFTADSIEFEPEDAQKIYKKVSDKEGVLGYYAYDDFEAYKENIAGLVMQNWSDPSDTSKYSMDEYLHLENGNKYVQGSAGWTQGRAFSLYSPLKTDYAHMHVDIKLNQGAVAFVGLGKEQQANTSSTNARANLANAAYFGENKLQLIKAVSNNKFDTAVTSTHIPVNTSFSVGEWHAVDFLFDMENKQFDIFIDGTPRVVDMYFTLPDNDSLPITDFTYKSAVVGVGEGASAPFCFDNVYVADVTGEYVADMFEEGYKKLLQDNTVAIGESRYLTEEFSMPHNGYAKGDDIRVAYETTNTGISIAERSSFSPYDNIKVAVKDTANGTEEGNFTVTIEKGGEERTVTIPMNLIPAVTPSLTKDSISLSAFPVSGTVAAGNTVTAKGFVQNNGSGPETVNLLLGIYDNADDNNKLVSVKVVPLTVPAGQLLPLQASLTLGQDLPTGCTAKAFVWNLGTLKALTSLQ